MNLPDIKYCPGTLAEGFSTYSRTCLKRVFNGKKVNHVLSYDSPTSHPEANKRFNENRRIMSISGVQEKFSLILVKNKLRLIDEGEHGEYILKPIPNISKNRAYMPANEHLTMQIASQAYGIETAKNALIFFNNGEASYITKRFDVKEDGQKWGQEDFASLAGRTPQTHGANYKYLGNYLALFQLMEKYLPAYKLDAPKLIKILFFNYLFSNGDAHFKNFSILETTMGDYRLSPAYDLLNSRMHIDDKDFALNDGLLPKNKTSGKKKDQFAILAEHAGIGTKIFNDIMLTMLSRTDQVHKLVKASYLSDQLKRNYLQSYHGRLKQLSKT